MCVCVCVCVCVISLHTAKNVCMYIPIGFTLKSEDFQLTDFSKTLLISKDKTFFFFFVLGLLAHAVHALISHTHALTGHTRDNNPALKTRHPDSKLCIPAQNSAPRLKTRHPGSKLGTLAVV